MCVLPQDVNDHGTGDVDAVQMEQDAVASPAFPAAGSGVRTLIHRDCRPGGGRGSPEPPSQPAMGDDALKGASSVAMRIDAEFPTATKSQNKALVDLLMMPGLSEEQKEGIIAEVHKDDMRRRGDAS